MKAKLFFLLLLLSTLISLPKASAVDVEPFAVTVEVSTYIETRIVVSYSFTQNVSSDANSAGKSVWRTTLDPLCSEFITSAADKFTWHLTVSYSMVVAQTVTVAVFSGDEPVDSWRYQVKTDKLLLDFDVTVTTQPKYPTAGELADRSIEVLENKLAEYVAEMKKQNGLSRQHDVMQWFVVMIVFAGFVAQVLLPHVKPSRREEPS